ncbi:hypothetical protein [Reichenbachiella agariperforans]|uniref:hypothetical protein n=1 Tax=Reichenbachiella agariperforans TaxID=156994 RepID=UPI001C0955E6|nr:hypothetical protein [Reichenbachiella agariperforans]MBU2913697.1 hypothetical protein [Reichenbachiella agariperforans]
MSVGGAVAIRSIGAMGGAMPTRSAVDFMQLSPASTTPQETIPKSRTTTPTSMQPIKERFVVKAG